MTTAYAITRPLMTAAELREHQATQYGRDYRFSDDGYSDMEVEEKRVWHALAGWGRDGWSGRKSGICLFCSGGADHATAGKSDQLAMGDG